MPAFLIACLLLAIPVSSSLHHALLKCYSQPQKEGRAQAQSGRTLITSAGWQLMQAGTSGAMSPSLSQAPWAPLGLEQRHAAEPPLSLPPPLQAQHCHGTPAVGRRRCRICTGAALEHVLFAVTKCAEAATFSQYAITHKASGQLKPTPATSTSAIPPLPPLPRPALLAVAGTLAASRSEHPSQRITQLAQAAHNLGERWAGGRFLSPAFTVQGGEVRASRHRSAL